MSIHALCSAVIWRNMMFLHHTTLKWIILFSLFLIFITFICKILGTPGKITYFVHNWKESKESFPHFLLNRLRLYLYAEFYWCWSQKLWAIPKAWPQITYMVDFEVCFGSLSCCKSQALFSFSFLTAFVIYVSRICWYLPESIHSTTYALFPVLLLHRSSANRTFWYMTVLCWPPDSQL